jgi:hypothetical protein
MKPVMQLSKKDVSRRSYEQDSRFTILLVFMAVAAGNDNRDACRYSPASSKLAITVGASTIADDRAYFSNWGTCTDVFAPGLNILSTWNTGPNSVNSTFIVWEVTYTRTRAIRFFYSYLWNFNGFTSRCWISCCEQFPLFIKTGRSNLAIVLYLFVSQALQPN